MPAHNLRTVCDSITVRKRQFIPDSQISDSQLELPQGATMTAVCLPPTGTHEWDGEWEAQQARPRLRFSTVTTRTSGCLVSTCGGTVRIWGDISRPSRWLRRLLRATLWPHAFPCPSRVAPTTLLGRLSAQSPTVGTRPP